MEHLADHLIKCPVAKTLLFQMWFPGFRRTVSQSHFALYVKNDAPSLILSIEIECAGLIN